MVVVEQHQHKLNQHFIHIYLCRHLRRARERVRETSMEKTTVFVYNLRFPFTWKGVRSADCAKRKWNQSEQSVNENNNREGEKQREREREKEGEREASSENKGKSNNKIM